MTDTARTAAEIKALLASNVTRDISAQDLRDLVESIANPIPGGGFGTKGEVLLVREATWSLANNQLKWIPFDGVKVDPNGWVNPATFVSSYSGQTVDANASVILPPGAYLFAGSAFYQGHPASGASQLLFDWTDLPPSTPPGGEWLSNWFYPQSQITMTMTTIPEGSGSRHSIVGYWFVDESFSSPVGLECRQDTGAPLNVLFATLHIMGVNGP